MTKKITYSVVCYCTNCDYEGHITFNKGTAVPESGILCPNCGCKTAVKRTRPHYNSHVIDFVRKWPQPEDAHPYLLKNTSAGDIPANSMPIPHGPMKISCWEHGKPGPYYDDMMGKQIDGGSSSNHPY